jgi:hypothetical protein
MNYNIKILQDTPFDKANTVLSIEAFRLKYTYLVNTHNSDYFVVNYIREDYKKEHLDIDLSKWFEVIEINSFKCGDWVWHEGLKQAFTIVIDNYERKEFRPNYCTLSSVINNPQIYKRLATKEEIQYYDLTSFCDGSVLIGQFKCYYFNNIWKELIGVKKNVLHYLKCFKEPTEKIYVMYNNKEERKFLCTFNGLKVGCQEITHQEVIQIAYILKINYTF